jgi:hypothetical protein
LLYIALPASEVKGGFMGKVVLCILGYKKILWVISSILFKIGQIVFFVFLWESYGHYVKSWISAWWMNFSTHSFIKLF